MQVNEIMTKDVATADHETSLEAIATLMKEENVGAIPVLDDDGELAGIITDRDIVVRCIAEGGDPQKVEAGELARGKPVTVGADDTIDVVLRTMKEHQVRRVPVIDGHKLVGVISQADVARNIEEGLVGDLVEAISS